MLDKALMASILDGLKDPFVFVDTDHYEEGESLLGRSVLDCHNPQSRAMILEIFKAMQNGEDERLITDNEKHRIYMRAVRDENGSLCSAQART